MRFARVLLPLLAVAIGCHEVDLDFSEDAGSVSVYDDLYSVSVVDGEFAVAVGYYGAAYLTADGGETWAKGRTGTQLSLYDVSMADERFGWAIGQRGLILRTEDGGRTWARQPNLKEEEGSHLFAVSAIDRNRAWAIGEWGTRIRTLDGGKTWQDFSFTIDEKHPQFVWLTPADQEKVRQGHKVYEDVGLTDIDCRKPPSTRCWIIGEFGYIFYSQDSGETWLRSKIEGSTEPVQVEMGFNQLELGEEAIAKLRDFAQEVKTEEHLNVAIAAVADAREIRQFGRAEDPSEFFEILEARAQEVRTVLEDAGIFSDRLRLRGQPPWDYEDFLEDDPDFLNRYLDSRLSSTPGVRIRVIQNPYLFTIRFMDDHNGLIAGLGGVILRSTDGGASWFYRKIDRKQALFAAAQVEGRAIAVGEKGLIRVSTDGGDSWLVPPAKSFPTIFTYMRDISFEPSGQVGFIVGQTGQVLRSTDAGYRWEQVLPPPSDAS